MRGLAITFLACALGCGEAAEQALQTPDASPGGADAGAGEDAGAFAPYAGWPAEVAVRQVGDGFRTAATKVEVDPRGHVWLLRKQWADPSPGFGAPVLERYEMDGRLDKRISFGAGALVPDFVLHPSGQLSVFVLEPDGPAGSFRLDVTRMSDDGTILGRKAFEDVAGPGENLFYDANGAHEYATDGPLRLRETSHVVGRADGEGLYLLAWTYGAKLYRLGPDDAQLWNALVMPANVGMAYYFTHELLAADEDGRIYVAYQLFADDVHIWADHFHRPPLTPIATYDVLVERFDAGGTFSGAQLFGGPGGDAPTEMTVHRGDLLVTGSTRVTKFDLPNRTREWDLFVLRANLDDGTRTSYRTLDLSRDDFGWSMVEAGDGTIYVAGRYDYVQVDTNSEVEDGKGLLLALSPDLTRRATLSLAGPRDVQLQALRLLPDGRLLFAGLRNGPLTHTESSMQFNEGVLGVTRMDPP